MKDTPKGRRRMKDAASVAPAQEGDGRAAARSHETPGPHGDSGSGPHGERIEFEGEDALVALVREPVRQALAGRPQPYQVSVERAGGSGEVRVWIAASNRRFPLRFAAADLEPSYIRSVIRNNVLRFGL